VAAAKQETGGMKEESRRRRVLRTAALIVVASIPNRAGKGARKRLHMLLGKDWLKASVFASTGLATHIGTLYLMDKWNLWPGEEMKPFPDPQGERIMHAVGKMGGWE
jgi:hypothetical protein